MSNFQRDYLKFLVCPLMHQSSVKLNIDEHIECFDANEMSKLQLEVLHSGSSREEMYTGTVVNSFAPIDEYFLSFADLDIDMMAINKRYTVSTVTGLSRLTSVPSTHPGYVWIYDHAGGIFSPGVFTKECLSLCADVWKKLKTANLYSVEFCGPAVTFLLKSTHGFVKSFDMVWTLKHTDWPKLARNFDNVKWPSATLAKEILNLGCHVVPVGYKHSKYCGYEWRVSFSEAEVKLADSLTTLQREFYIAFKFLLKKIVSGPKVYSTYCLKNAFFWFVQCYDGKWAYEEMDVIINGLLDDVKSYLNKHYLPQFFIPQNNLISQFDKNDVEQKVKEISLFQSDFVDYLASASYDNRNNFPLLITNYYIDNISELQVLKTDESLFVLIGNLSILLTLLMVLSKGYMEKFYYLKKLASNFHLDGNNIPTCMASVVKACEQIFIGINKKVTERFSENLIKVLFQLKRTMIECVCDEQQTGKNFLQLAAFVEKHSEIDEIVANTNLVLNMSNFGYNTSIDLMLNFFDEFLELFPRHNLSIECLSEFMIERLHLNAKQCESALSRSYTWSASLHFAVKYHDKKGIVEPLAKNLIMTCQKLLQLGDKRTSFAGCFGFNTCLELLSISRHADQQFVTESCLQYAIHYWNYLEKYNQEPNELEEGLRSIEKHLELATNICLERFEFYLLHYCRFLMKQKRFLESIELLNDEENANCFQGHDVIIFDQYVSMTTERWMQLLILEKKEIKFSFVCFRMYILASCYSCLNKRQKLHEILEAQKPTADGTNDQDLFVNISAA